MELYKRLQQAHETGTLWIVGEMAFPIKQGAYEAHKIACYIAEQCGYLVSWQHRGSSFIISGGDIVGYIVGDWYDGAVIVKVEHWTCQTAWMQEV